MRQLNSLHQNARPDNASVELIVLHAISLPAQIVGHQDIAPGRKWDPGRQWDWQHFRRSLSRIQRFDLEVL